MLKFKPIVEFAVSTRPSLDKLFKMFNYLVTSKSSSRIIHTSYGLGKIPGIVYPNGYSFEWAWKAAIPNIDIYTHEALPKIRTGGRGPDGHVALKCIGGGLKRPYFMVSPFRGGLSNDTEDVIEEKILYIHKNWWRHENIALVSRNTQKRWIYATTTMKAGDIVRSYGKSNHLIKNPKEGDAYPIGCLALGLTICQIERYPGKGAWYAINAGSSGLIQQKYADNSCLIKVGKRLFVLSSGCSAVVGQMSNPDHKLHKFTTFGQKRRLGIKQRSGLFQKKTGRFGRKIRNPRKYDFTLTETKNDVCTVIQTKHGYADARKKKGTFEKPVNVKAIPLEENEIHPKFRWCTWSSVR